VLQCSSFQQLLLFFLPPKKSENVGGKKGSVSSVILTNSNLFYEKILQIFSTKNLKTKTGCVGI
jgi:hypothetical protein